MTKDDMRKMAKAFRDYKNPDNEGNLTDFACQVANAILDELESKNEEVEIDSEEGGYVGRAVCLRHFGLLRLEINHNG
jgi:hypothetical protein